MLDILIDPNFTEANAIGGSEGFQATKGFDHEPHLDHSRPGPRCRRLHRDRGGHRGPLRRLHGRRAVPGHLRVPAGLLRRAGGAGRGLRAVRVDGQQLHVVLLVRRRQLRRPQHRAPVVVPVRPARRSVERGLRDPVPRSLLARQGHDLHRSPGRSAHGRDRQRQRPGDVHAARRHFAAALRAEPDRRLLQPGQWRRGSGSSIDAFGDGDRQLPVQPDRHLAIRWLLLHQLDPGRPDSCWQYPTRRVRARDDDLLAPPGEVQHQRPGNR